jgi:glycosyltransferase involved in cell wall biosynthesis
MLVANHLNVGGISSYVATLSRGLAQSGHRVIVVTSGGELVPGLESPGIRHVPMNLGIKSEIHPLLFLNLPRLLALLKEERIDVIHAQTRVTAMLAAAASKVSGVPYVTTCHGYFKSHMGRSIAPLWGRRTIAISRPVIDHLTQDLGIPAERIELVPNGIDVGVFRSISVDDRDTLRKKWRLGAGPVIGMIARLSDVKGHVYLIDAMAEVKKSYPDVKCLLLGDGPLEEALKDRAASRGVGDVVFFYPVVNRTAEVLGLFDIFVVPSVSEGLGLSAMEAMAAGLPVVASSVGGLLDLIKDGETGRLVPSKDPTALAGAIKDLLADRVAASRMGERAQAFIAANFSVEKMVAGTVGVYEKVVGKSREYRAGSREN